MNVDGAIEVVTVSASNFVVLGAFVYMGTAVGVGDLVTEESADGIGFIGGDEAEVTAIGVKDFDGIFVVAVLWVGDNLAVEILTSEVFDAATKIDARYSGAVNIRIEVSPKVEGDMLGQWACICAVDDGFVCLPVEGFVCLANGFFLSIGKRRACRLGRLCWLLWFLFGRQCYDNEDDYAHKEDNNVDKHRLFF